MITAPLIDPPSEEGGDTSPPPATLVRSGLGTSLLLSPYDDVGEETRSLS